MSTVPWGKPSLFLRAAVRGPRACACASCVRVPVHEHAQPCEIKSPQMRCPVVGDPAWGAERALRAVYSGRSAAECPRYRLCTQDVRVSAHTVTCSRETCWDSTTAKCSRWSALGKDTEGLGPGGATSFPPVSPISLRTRRTADVESLRCHYF